ncbi:chorismate mutase [Streptomyces sp. DSM 44917]|uniref:Chorismate mutase n=1 Tax=Streptomyces boetiae TaxID=3075541 RepID=A0ABU2LAC4_9ACTN|nr:chorismate mutase [Streptomyces sp. DSM 44917]MDT0308521.1 chorismate mutase [Streptomyces sp. DSM 44917]
MDTTTTSSTTPTDPGTVASGAAVPDTTPAGTGDEAADAVIARARGRIDALDGRIVELIQERMAASAEVQRARISAGGRRVHLAREMEILRRYRDGLGRPGTALAMTLLELCRGRV